VLTHSHKGTSGKPLPVTSRSGSFKLAHGAATYIVRERLRDFIKGLERRLNRDIKRVYEYYETLKLETKALIERRTVSSEQPFFIEEGVTKDARIERLTHKLDAIEAERERKIRI